MNVNESQFFWNSKAAILLHLKNWPQLLSLSVRWLTQTPDSPEAHFYAAMATLRLGQLKQAAEHVRTLLELAPQEFYVHDVACLYWLQSNQPTYALYHAQRMIEIDPPDARGHYLASFAFEPINLTAAKAAVAFACQLDPNDADYARRQLQIELEQPARVQELPRLEKRFFEVLHLDPEMSSSHELLGDFYMNEVGNSQRALVFYRNALEIDPADTACRAKFALAYKASNLFLRALFIHETIGHFNRGWTHVPVAALLILPSVFVAIVLIVVGAILFYVPGLIVTLLFFPESMQTPETLKSVIRRDFYRFPIWFRCAFCGMATLGHWSFLAIWVPWAGHWDLLLFLGIYVLCLLTLVMIDVFRRSLRFGAAWVTAGFVVLVDVGIVVGGLIGGLSIASVALWVVAATLGIWLFHFIYQAVHWQRQRFQRIPADFRVPPAPLPSA